MGKKKSKDKQQAKAREKRSRTSRERRQRQSSQRSTSGRAEHLPAPSLVPVQPDRLMSPVHVDRSGAIVPDPRQVLGLEAGERDPEVIRRAWREQLVAHPPEAEPELAREIREARDRLIEPDRLLERVLGVLQVPDAAAWGLTTELSASDGDKLDVEARIAGQAVLYALVEDALLEGGVSEWLDKR